MEKFYVNSIPSLSGSDFFGGNAARQTCFLRFASFSLPDDHADSYFPLVPKPADNKRTPRAGWRGASSGRVDTAARAQ